MSSYRVAPIFLIRATGVPFEHLESFATAKTSEAARQLLVRRKSLAQARKRAEDFLGSRASGLSADDSRAYRSLLRSSNDGDLFAAGQPNEISGFTKTADEARALEAQLHDLLQDELEGARRALAHSSKVVLPGYLLFGAGEFYERLSDFQERISASENLPPRNARTRERERHMLLYLQRLCAKNDTFSEFGPSAWGKIGSAGVSFPSQTEMFQRCAFLERWTAHVFASAINQDPEARAELSPRLNPNGRMEPEGFLQTENGGIVPLSKSARELLARCDGATPAHSLGLTELQQELASQRVILWECEVPALEPEAFEVLHADIAGWRASPTRARWLERAQSIAALPKALTETNDLAGRIAVMNDARRLLAEIGARPAGGQRSLYVAANPIAEECSREVGFELSEKVMDEAARDAEPWFDLWRDTYAFVAGRVAEGLRGLFQTAPVQNNAVPLAAFLQHCAANKLPLTGHGLVAFAHMAFQEVKGAFREMVSERAQAAEWELTAEDCAFVRRSFKFERFDEYTYPAADLQLSATSFEAVKRGDFQWVVSELHPPIAMLHHALYWSCPDKAALAQELARTTFGRPTVHYGFFAADFTAHTTVRLFDALPETITFVAGQRSNAKWRTVPPAEVEVFVNETNGDVALRRRGSNEDLGSFARSWVIPLGFHPFHFGASPHMPRLRCGRTIVQRRSWTVAFDELAPGDYAGVATDLVLAIEQLREIKDWPRYIFIRPTEQALRRSGAEGRDKDTKPVFIDLESYLSLEVFHRWLKKSGELEVTEMLPDPDHLCWREADGRRTFELRTLIVPRS